MCGRWALGPRSPSRGRRSALNGRNSTMPFRSRMPSRCSTPWRCVR
ncbi:hypothetical protein EVA_09057 [gut metagenome]|uniref:Uncharacterized protein n=1 Tax=gut metagenome TaxID=749906 RepID=J9CRM3_9ZZZZ